MGKNCAIGDCSAQRRQLEESGHLWFRHSAYDVTSVPQWMPSLPQVHGSWQAVSMAIFDTNLYFAAKLTIHLNANYLKDIPKLQ